MAGNQGDSLLQQAADRVAAQVVDGRQDGPTTGPPLSEMDSSATGVVFVHGIGAQARAEILLGWSKPIVRAVADWATSLPEVSDPVARWSTDRVVRSQIDFEGVGLPLVTIRVPAATVGIEDFGAQTWVMTEARWAEDVEPPTLETMIDWCGPRGVVASVVQRIVAQTMMSESEARASARAGPAHSNTPAPPLAPPDARAPAVAPRLGAGRAAAEMGLGSIVSVFVTFGLFGYALVRVVAAIVPYAPLQDALARISLNTFLTDSWGDVYVLLDDPVQAANIRGQVAKTIDALRAFGCERIVVVAHSGGTIVSYMALSDPALVAKADTLVTYGEAIQMGRSIHAAEGDEPTSPGVRIERGLPLRIRRWRDFHATHDPAPAGRLDEANPGTPPAPRVSFRDTEVWNRMSIAEDHGTYFENDEEFVEGVLTEIETAGRSASPSRFLSGHSARVERRQQRVFILALWRRLMFVIPLVAIMAAFLTPSAGLLPELRDGAHWALAILPGARDAVEALHRVLPPPGADWFITAAASLFAAVYLLAIVQAALPIGRSEIWSGWRKVVFVFLDVGVFFLGVALAFLVRTSQSGGPARGAVSLASRLGDISLRNGFIIVAVIFVILAVGRFRSGLDALSRRAPLLTRLVVVLGALGITATAIGGVIIDVNIRMVVVATGVAIVLYQVLARVGAWRWGKWDGSERAIARRRSSSMFRRRSIWLEFLILGTIAMVVAVSIGLGRADLLRAAGVALAVLLGLLLVIDVIAHGASPGRPSSLAASGSTLGATPSSVASGRT